MHEHVTMHIYAVQTACDYACMCMWLCTSMLCSQFVTMYAKAWAMHLCAMQSSRDYVCLCMWLCTFTPCSQFVTLHARACEYACMCMWLFTSMLCCQLVTMYAWAYEYVHLCHAFSYANDSLVVSGPLNWLIQQTIPSWEKYLVFATYLVFYWTTQ